MLMMCCWALLICGRMKPGYLVASNRNLFWLLVCLFIKKKKKCTLVVGSQKEAQHFTRKGLALRSWTLQLVLLPALPERSLFVGSSPRWDSK